MRPYQPWGDVVQVLNRGRAAPWSVPGRSEAMRERTPRGGTRWHPSSVKHLLLKADRLGLVGTASARVGCDMGLRRHTSIHETRNALSR
jgi:hypothetical protein